jgi:putative PIN family toxin of toxin-antitoxin system
MSSVERFVFDTSTLVGAALRLQSVPREAFRVALSRGRLCACATTLAELEDVLAREKLARYQTPEYRAGFVRDYRSVVQEFPVSDAEDREVVLPCRDLKDNKFLALAQRCGASLIVSSDKDLLVLHPWQGIPILTPVQFLARSYA